MKGNYMQINNHVNDNRRSSQKAVNKNGEIEFLRFLCCMGVLLFHAGKYVQGEPSLKNGIHFDFFPHGSVCVEFFFLLSGFFMAKSIYRKIENQKPGEQEKLCRGEMMTKEYLQFLAHKYLRILPQHIVAFVITFIIYVMAKNTIGMNLVSLVLNNLSSFFLIQMSGLYFSNVNHVEWYISCMLIAMAILYPICRKYYFYFTRYYAPLFSLLLLGYMIHTTSALTGVSTWMGISYKSLMRALAEIALGTTAFEISRCISASRRFYEPKNRIIFTAVKYASIILVALYVLLTLPKKFEIYALMLFVIIIVISFSGISYGTRLFQNRICCYLGDLSLPLYLAQLSAVYIVTNFLTGYSEKRQIVLIVLNTFLIGYVIKILGRMIEKKFFFIKA